MTPEELQAADPDQLSDEEARQAAIALLKEELRGTKRVVPFIVGCLIVLMLIGFGWVWLTGQAEGLIAGFVMGLGGICLEGLSGECGEWRRNRRALKALEARTFEGSPAALLREIRDRRLKRQEELEKYRKKDAGT